MTNAAKVLWFKSIIYSKSHVQRWSYGGWLDFRGAIFMHWWVLVKCAVTRWGLAEEDNSLYATAYI